MLFETQTLFRYAVQRNHSHEFGQQVGLRPLLHAFWLASAADELSVFASHYNYKIIFEEKLRP
jgi:hypothetical protein